MLNLMTPDLELQHRLVAKLLEQIHIIEPESDSEDYGNCIHFKWRNSNGEYPDDWFDVTDREWDYIVRIVEESISFEGQEEYMTRLMSQVHSVLCDWQLTHASWQQRAQAMVDCGII